MPNSLRRTLSDPDHSQTLQLQRLEQELAEALDKLANYEREQLASVKAFKQQEQLLTQKDQQLEQKDNLLVEKEELVNRLKARIKELTDKSKVKDLEAQVVELESNLETALSHKEALELALFEKRLANLKEFSKYQEKLKKLEAMENTELTKANKKIAFLTEELKKNEFQHKFSFDLNTNALLLFFILTTVIFLLTK